MGLIHITTVALVVQLYVAGGADLPTLHGNTLLTGKARELPNSKEIECRTGKYVEATYKTTNKIVEPSKVSNSEFKSHPFTAHSVVPGGLIHGGVGKFSFSELKPESGPVNTHVYGLQIDSTGRTGESAYWLPQGGQIDILEVPSGTPSINFVFTADFSGCSLTVTPMANGHLRLRHVEGGKEDEQFNHLSEADKGGPVTYAMQYKDYGYVKKDGHLISNVPAYSYMHFSDGKWEIHGQHKTCAPLPGNFHYGKNGLLETMLMIYYDQKTYAMIDGTFSFTIPKKH